MAILVQRGKGNRDYQEVGPEYPLAVEVYGKERKVNVGGSQYGLAVTSSPAVKLKAPADATRAEIYVRTASVVFKRDGTAATATAGIQADESDIILLESAAEIENFRVIAVSASATLDVEYFRYVSA